jgi:hypothetical protein
MKTHTLQKQILEKIRERQLRPTPKGFFYARDIIIWVLFGIFVAALSLGFAMTMFMVHGTDFDLFEKLGLSAGEKIVYSIPFFWIAASIALAMAVFINFRNTKRGYRMNTKQFIFVATLVVIASGSVIYSLDIAEYVDKKASENFSIYNYVIPLNTNTWLDPERGLLSGVVRDRESESDFMLRDVNAVLWHITGNNIEISKDFIWASGDRIKIIGIQIGVDEFRALEILPWEEKIIKEKVQNSN